MIINMICVPIFDFREEKSFKIRRLLNIGKAILIKHNLLFYASTRFAHPCSFMGFTHD